MTSPRKALIRYDLLTAGALGCAALLLVMLFAGCNPAKAKSAGSAMNFTVGNGQFRGACSALAPLEALKRSCCRGKTQKAKQNGCPHPRSWASGHWIASVRCSKPRWRMFAGRKINVAKSGRQVNEGIHEI